MKKNMLVIILELILLIIFNVVFYMFGGTVHPMSVWVSYIFIHVAYVLMIVIPFLNPQGRDRVIFGLTSGVISAIYFLIEFVVGIAFIWLALLNVKVVFIIQLIILAIYLIILITNMLANEATAESVDRQQQEIQYIKEAAASIKSVMEDIEDKAVYKKVEKAYDLIKASPSKSNSRVADIEHSVMNEIENLRSAVAGGDSDAISASADKVYRLGSERNRQLRLTQ
ncbi:MAG: hypothetical protein LUG54_04220 [Clostridiales bacterium]|nr:hypothetical protein [Clostridiales bacterium]